VLDARIVFIVLGSALVTGLAAGVVPALQVSNPNVGAVLKDGGRSGTVQRSRKRATLLVLQAALSVVLLAGAGLFLRSLGRVQDVDIGYDASRLISAAASHRSSDCALRSTGTFSPSGVCVAMPTCTARCRTSTPRAAS